MAIKNLIQLRKGSSSEWSSINPVLASGEPGYDLTNNIIKVGDGATAWNNLSGIGSTVVSSSGSVDLDTTLVAGTGINFSYNNDTLTINSNLVSPPPSATASGNIGQFSYDNEFFYVCINNNLWKRTSLNSW